MIRVEPLLLVALLVACSPTPGPEGEAPPPEPEVASTATPEAPPAAAVDPAHDAAPVETAVPPEATPAPAVPTIDALPDPAGFPDTPLGLSNGAFTPELAHTDLRTGEAFKLSDWIGPTATEPVDALVVGFTASWCGPCKQSYPFLQQMQNEHEGRLKVVLVTVDAAQPAKEKHAELVTASGLEAPLLDPSIDTLRAWLGQKKNVPHFYIVNKIGEILVQDRGFGNNVKRVLPGQLRFALNHPEYVIRRK